MRDRLTFLANWIGLLVAILALATVVWRGGALANTVEGSHERRITALEQNQRALSEMAVEMRGISVKLDALKEAVEEHKRQTERSRP